MFNVLSLFAGVGGFDLGLERTGAFKTVAFCEIDPYACKVLAERWPDVPNLGDVTTAEFPDADIICAGFPCQDISLAGLGAGLAGARSGLWREVVRAVRVVRPKLVLLENVAALLGRGLDAVLRDLAEVGYDAEWHCIPASAIGAPHRRDRIWIIAHPRSEQHEGGSATFSGSIAEELLSANASGERWDGCWVGSEPSGRDKPANLGEIASHAPSERRGEARCGKGGSRSSRSRRPICTDWAVEPDVGRVAHGVPARVDRLKALGNAVVPQIPELLGRALVQAIEARSGETTQIGSTEGESAVAKPCTERKAA